MQVCLPAGCIDAIRIAKVDDCTDQPLEGASNGYIFNCFRNLELTSNTEEGEETILRNDCGKKCFQTKQDDELTNITVAFELLSPDYELTALLTGQPLINDGGENIGWYQEEGKTKSPWVSVELFEQVPDENCEAGHRYRRIVLPKVSFGLPESTREGMLRVVPMSGTTAAAQVSAWGTGPFNDSPFDFTALDDDIHSHYIELFDDVTDNTLEGTCGFVAVPSQGTP